LDIQHDREKTLRDLNESAFAAATADQSILEFFTFNPESEHVIAL
jgi:hypothetical protein